VEDVKVNKQMLADARIKGMKAVASLAGHTNTVNAVAFLQSRRAKQCVQ
jgi:hypothetical protein